ncbi:hypothetical protein BC828DRAFT_405520, partial [Blastocladiella britannica]
MTVLDIATIVDDILLQAGDTEHTLAAGLELMRVLPRFDLPDTHRHVLHRLVDVHDLGSAGHIGELKLLKGPLSDRDITRIASGAAEAGHARVLDWLLSVRPAHD